MARERRAYDDNEMERLSFQEAAPSHAESGPDLQTVQSDLKGQQGSDLRTVQSDLIDRSDCSDGQVRLTCETGQSDLQSISDPPGTISRPSVPQQRPHDGEDGGTDGSAPPEEKIGSNEGVKLLLAIGAKKPEFLLTGKTLRDQGLMVAGMLDVGWTAEHLWHVIAGRDLPSPIRTTVGAVVSSRLRAAVAGPVPRQGDAPQAFEERETPTPTDWSESRDLIALGDRPGECEGLQGSCGRPAERESRLCRFCLDTEPIRL